MGSFFSSVTITNPSIRAIRRKKSTIEWDIPVTGSFVKTLKFQDEAFDNVFKVLIDRFPGDKFVSLKIFTDFNSAEPNDFRMWVETNKVGKNSSTEIIGILNIPGVPTTAIIRWQTELVDGTPDGYVDQNGKVLADDAPLRCPFSLTIDCR